MADLKLQQRLGTRCRVLRERAGLSQMDVVKQFDVSLSHLGKIERGKLDPRLSTLRKLADAYDVTLSTLLRDV
jgi:transcriptional regulator with XRE-family HTH domain